MRVTPFLVTGVIALVILAAGGPEPAVDPAPPSQSEVARLQAHFDSVDGELRQADVSRLNQAQRASRARLIGWLREYRNSGEFPVNDRFPDRAMPFFRDSRGVLCAMAWLVERSGRPDMVDRIARTRNNAFIPELAHDQQLAHWLDSTGLTLAEATRIQPSYNYGQSTGVSTGYAFTSLFLSGGTLVAGGFNLFAPTTTSGWLGIGTGLAAGIVGLTTAWDQPDDATMKLSAVNFFAGIVGLALGVRGVIAGGGKREPLPPEASAEKPVISWTIAPSVLAQEGAPRFGVIVKARF